jgi:hypothetical protein
MIRFKLEDENNEYKEYSINIDFESVEDFDNFTYEDSDFELFMEKMECGEEDYCGVHDITGGIDEDGIEWVGYQSYEIKNFNKAIQKWEKFFKIKGLLTRKTI